jgi:hypothetical protein
MASESHRVRKPGRHAGAVEDHVEGVLAIGELLRLEDLPRTALLGDATSKLGGVDDDDGAARLVRSANRS